MGCRHDGECTDPDCHVHRRILPAGRRAFRRCFNALILFLLAAAAGAALLGHAVDAAVIVAVVAITALVGPCRKAGPSRCWMDCAVQLARERWPSASSTWPHSKAAPSSWPAWRIIGQSAGDTLVLPAGRQR